MNKGVPASLDDVILACALGESEYPVRVISDDGPPDRAAILALSPDKRRELVDRDWNRELVGDDVEIWHAEIAVAELDDCYYRGAPPWTGFTGGTHRVRDGAHELDALDEFAQRRVQWAIESSGPFQPLVIFSPAEDGPKVIVHGAARATAHLRCFAETRMLDAFWGISDRVVKWPWWPSIDA